jgi:hypothetical protein
LGHGTLSEPQFLAAAFHILTKRFIVHK